MQAMHLFISLLAVFAVIQCTLATIRVQVANFTTLGPDPQTVNHVNGESFQQDAIATFKGYQYAVWWVADAGNASIRHATVSRRPIPSGSWESFALTDYDQTDDDGHDIISFGISRGDGTLHIIFDQHDNPLNYRATKPGVATNPENTTWSADLFGGITNFLPGLPDLDKSTHFINITYPRFLLLPASTSSSSSLQPDLLLEMRVGRSGLGDDWLYHYTPGGNWSLVGKYLEGVNNNAYINGLDFDATGSLHVTWAYRDFVNDTGADVAVEAGPNGPENNHDMNYSFSPDLGFTWLNNWNQTIANLSLSKEVPTAILPVSAGITIFGIPKYRGILNQEAQTVDSEGRIHVLNRENTTGIEQWYHYWRSTTTHWTRTPFPLSFPSPSPSINNITNTPTVIGKRGKLVPIPSSLSTSTTLLALLPSNAPNSTGLTILASTAVGHFRDWNVVWEVMSGCSWEPLFDRYRLVEDGVLSLFLVNGTDVGVLDLNLDLSGV